MDVSNILESHTAKLRCVAVEKETPLQVDVGLLTITDLNPVDEESYKENLDEHLQFLARDGVQVLFATLFSLPTKPSPDGPLATLPTPTYQLPRAKPLPKPKPLTKWEQFAAAKGIQKTVREKRVWDEEKQDWVNRWGREGKNKEIEQSWITEVPANADVDHDPRKVSREARMKRISENEKKRQQNIARAAGSPRQERKMEIEKTLATTKVSTASMGKFDKWLDGEKKIRGVKRKFDPTEVSVEQEKNASLSLFAKMDSDHKKMGKEPRAEETELNIQKAVRFASRGKAGLGLGREIASRLSRGRGNRGKGSRGGRGR